MQKPPKWQGNITLCKIGFFVIIVENSVENVDKSLF